MTPDAVQQLFGLIVVITQGIILGIAIAMYIHNSDDKKRR